MEIRVSHANLDVSPTRLNSLFELLSPEERERALRFRFPRHRDHFIAGRGILREILAARLEIAARQVRFIYGPHGKPEVPASDLRFNLSHSAGHALYAAIRGREVGVDIECMDRRFSQDGIPERFFSPGEVRQLRALPPSQQMGAFFRCWTRKEAYIKARGLGLALPLDSFDVTLAPGEPAAFVRGGENWTLKELPAPEGFAAALVVEGCEREEGNTWNIEQEEIEDHHCRK
jgi:4'-phosphopantetheinyl transferase